MAMFLSSFGKPFSPGCFYHSNTQGNFGTFQLSIISISWICFLSAPLIENSKPYRSGITTSTSHSRKLESSFAEISSVTFQNLSNLL